MNYLTRQPWPDGDTTSSDADAWVIVQALCGGFSRCRSISRSPGSDAA